MSAAEGTRVASHPIPYQFINTWIYHTCLLYLSSVIKTKSLRILNGLRLRIVRTRQAGIWPGVPALFPTLHTTPPPRLLDLAHGGPATADSTAHVDARGASTHDGEDHGGNPSSPAKPEESGRGLGLTATLLRVVAAVGNLVGKGVGPVAAAVHMQICGRRDGGTEPKDDVERVQGYVGHGHAEAVKEGCRQEIQQGEQAKGGGKHVVIDHGRVAFEGRRDHVTNKTHDDDGADELPGPQSNVQSLGHHGR